MNLSLQSVLHNRKLQHVVDGGITGLKQCGWSSILGATIEFGSFSSLSCSDLVSFNVKRQTSSIWLEVCRLIKQN